MYYRGGKVRSNQNLFPRSNSLQSVGSTGSSNVHSVPVRPQNPFGQVQVPSVTTTKTTSSDANAASAIDDGFDENDDQLLSQQVAEIERALFNPEVVVAQAPTECDQDQSSVTPSENLILRRQRLQERENNVGTGGTGGCTEDDYVPSSSQTQGTADKDELIKLRGQASILKAQKQGLEKEIQKLQADLLKRNNKVSDNTKKDEEEIKKLRAEIQLLRSEQLSAKARRMSPSITRSRTVSNGRPETHHSPSDATAAEFPSYMDVSSQSYADVHPSPLKPSVSRFIQTDKGPDGEIGAANDIEYLYKPTTSEDILEKIFQNIDKIAELCFQMVLPKLERVVKAAPKEIARRLVPRCDIKSTFPSVVDSMLYWNLENERKKVRETAGVSEPKFPHMPSHFQNEGSGLDYYKIKNVISSSYKSGGSWYSLVEVKKYIENILRSIQGENRFRLYEYHTLMNFWRLLFWARELWRWLPFEEENDDLVEHDVGAKKWATELKKWTGLVLKTDWRHYFDEDLEEEVRKLTLHILESIVVNGYFEQQSTRRYEILYQILKDVLLKDRFRTIDNVRSVLKIVTWLLPDRFVMKHMCYKHNEVNTCLARIIGENVLKLCRDEKDPFLVTVVYLDYAWLLESLLRDKPIALHQSKYAKQDEETTDDRPPSPVQGQGNNVAMDDLTEASQFACPVKYVVPPSVEPMELEDQELNPFGWLKPQNYEDPYGQKKLCQCRKAMVGTAVLVMQRIMDCWFERYAEYENQIEREEALELEELHRLMQEPVQENEYLQYLKSKRRAIDEILPKASEYFKTVYPLPEWNWDDVIRHAPKFIGTEVPSCIQEWKRPSDVFDIALSKGLVLMNCFVKSENLAAAMGSEAYKAYMTMLPNLRIHMNRFESIVDQRLLLALTADCEEKHLGTLLTSLCSEEVELEQVLPIVPNKGDNNINLNSIPEPLLPDLLSADMIAELEAESKRQWDKIRSQPPEEREGEPKELENGLSDFMKSEFINASGRFTYVPTHRK